MHTIDIGFEGRANAIAACAIETDDGVVVVDPGPASCVGGLGRGLEAVGLSLDDISAILLTHIHLDHGGATGTLVREHHRIHVYVHDRGARHIVDPSKLLASADRIYGESLPVLFGEIAPVPPSAVRVVHGGETIEHGGRTFRVEYAAGHASHHVVWLDEATGTLFTGDTAGERFAPSTFVMPVTPPPDIDLEQWRQTLSLIRALDASRLFVTHFGGYEDVARHLDEHEARLADWADAVRISLDEPGGDEERARRFAERVDADLKAGVSADEASPYAHAGVRDSWFGLARYWRRRAVA
jgi:glyoxylase-like metal-dependent hydrolase (beta-lactamase superfamily II)